MAHVTSLGLGTIGLTPIILSWFGVKDPTHWQIVGFSGLLILATTLVNLLRVRIVALVNNIGVASEFLASLTVIVGCTVAFVLGKSHQPMSFLTTDAGVVNGSIVLPLLYSCLLAAFMCSGFDVSGTAGEETHDASRVVPKAAVTANVISLVIGSLVLLMLLLSVPNVQGVLDDVSPVKYILDSVLGSGLASAFEFLAVAALLVNGMVLQAAGARVFWAQARDGAFIGSKWLRRINTDGVPVNGVILSGLIAFALTIYSSLYPVLAAILAVSWAAAYGIAVLIGWRARRAGLLPARAFTLRAGNLWYVVAIVWSAFLCIILTYQEPQKVGVGVLIIIAVGLVVYYTSRSQLPASEPTTTPAPAPRPTAASTNTEEP
ncbi:APC family permease (plasmid) [Mycobacterium sp. TJFP1]